MADPRAKKLLSTGPGLFDSINYEIESSGYRETYQEGSPRIQIPYRVRWNSSAIWATNMLGSHGTTEDRTSGVSRFLPAMFPDEDYEPALFTQTAGAVETVCPFLGWWCTGIDFVDVTSEFALQNQTTGFYQTSIKPASQIVAGVDYDAGNGDMLDPGYDATYSKPVQTGDGLASYLATFEPLPYELRTDTEMDALDAPLNGCELSRYVIRDYRFGGNQFNLPGGALYWRDRLETSGAVKAAHQADAMIAENYPRIFPEANVTYTWLKVPGIPWDAINNCMGKVNKAETGTAAPSGKFDYRPDWQGLFITVSGDWTRGVINGFLPGTLLFLGVSDVRPVIGATGQCLWDISYAFSYRKTGHNKIYRHTNDTGVLNADGTDPAFQQVVRGATRTLGQASWKDLLDEEKFTTLFKLSAVS